MYKLKFETCFSEESLNQTSELQSPRGTYTNLSIIIRLYHFKIANVLYMLIKHQIAKRWFVFFVYDLFRRLVIRTYADFISY